MDGKRVESIGEEDLVHLFLEYVNYDPPPPEMMKGRGLGTNILKKSYFTQWRVNAHINDYTNRFESHS